jgi:DNA primase
MEIVDFDLSTFKNLKVISEKNDNLFKINEEASKYFSNFLKNNDNKDALKYLYSRNITEELIKKHDIGFAPKDSSILIDLLTNNENILNNDSDGYNNLDIKKTGLSSVVEGKYNSFFYNRIIFPIHNIDDRIIGFSGRVIDNKEPKYLNTPTTEIFNKNKTLYNLNNVVKNINTEKIYIAEGFMDVIAIEKLGIQNIVCTMGTSFGNEHIKLLKQLYDLKSIVLCFDNDEAGIEASIKNGELLNKHYDVFVVNYDSDFKDIDEIYNKDGIDKVLKILQNVDYFSIFLLKRISKKYNFKDDSDLNSFIKVSQKIVSEIKSDLFYLKTIEILSEITSLSIEQLVLIYKKNNKNTINKSYYDNKKDEKIFFKNYNINNI